jgi:uncharacterized membrane protein
MKRVFLIVFGILLLPLIAMQFSSEVNWNIFDFLMMGFLLTTTLFLIRYSKKHTHNTTIIICVVAIFLTIWIQLAVGIF